MRVTLGEDDARFMSAVDRSKSVGSFASCARTESWFAFALIHLMRLKGFSFLGTLTASRKPASCVIEHLKT